MVKREKLLLEVRAALRRSRAVAIIGPRQCGKTTLAHQLVVAVPLEALLDGMDGLFPKKVRL